MQRPEVKNHETEVDRSEDHGAMVELIGRRIANLRAQRGWTQQTLAARLAVSRVAVSHIEMDLSIPSERTITLLAGLFKMTPHELVEGTTYPQAKTDKLPETACCYTKLEHRLELLERDLAWLERIKDRQEAERIKAEVRRGWSAELEEWAQGTSDEGEREMIEAARKKLAAACGRG